MRNNIFDAARDGDLKSVKKILKSNPEINATHMVTCLELTKNLIYHPILREETQLCILQHFMAKLKW
jgi:hypothetical protein